MVSHKIMVQHCLTNTIKYLQFVCALYNVVVIIIYWIFAIYPFYDILSCIVTFQMAVLISSHSNDKAMYCPWFFLNLSLNILFFLAYFNALKTKLISKKYYQFYSLQFTGMLKTLHQLQHHHQQLPSFHRRFSSFLHSICLLWHIDLEKIGEKLDER